MWTPECALSVQSELASVRVSDSTAVAGVGWSSALKSGQVSRAMPAAAEQRVSVRVGE